MFFERLSKPLPKPLAKILVVVPAEVVSAEANVDFQEDYDFSPTAIAAFIDNKAQQANDASMGILST